MWKSVIWAMSIVASQAEKRAVGDPEMDRIAELEDRAAARLDDDRLRAHAADRQPRAVAQEDRRRHRPRQLGLRRRHDRHILRAKQHLARRCIAFPWQPAPGTEEDAVTHVAGEAVHPPDELRDEAVGRSPINNARRAGLHYPPAHSPAVAVSLPPPLRPTLP